ncbi:hypothetical protein [Haloferula sp. BvORR071]|uniref:hypothetical protein n=1 Tax=Haloferula sp. BvORR071 TaxID=1396141 RepID=UPI002240FFEA|nr:hypothetical protein [Haloferula sp. BvORR071]
MEPDNVLRQRAIDMTISQFDFGKVQKAAATFSMRWDQRPGVREPLSVEQIKDIARELLEKAWDDDLAPNCEYCHGGLRATRTDGVLALQFVLEESFFVAAIDAEAA